MHKIISLPAFANASALFLLAGLSACSSGNVPKLSAGSTWVVEKTTETSDLLIPDGAAIAAPAGKYLTMTVNGIDLPIAPGKYSGAVVLTVTEDIPVKYHDLDPHHYRAALYVNDGHIVPEKSVRSALVGGHVSDTAASDVVITSNEDKFNGIYVTGNSRYSITHPTIRFTGNGGNDFAGFGAAIVATGKADVTVDKASIINKGAVRTAVFVGGDATVHVNDSNIEVYNGTLPAGYKWNVDLGKMFEVPWMLGLSGNVRATNLVENGTVYYNRSHIKTQGWGALSTDDSKHVRMYVNDSTIETVESGYGAYSIGDSIDQFSHTTFNVADVGVIMGAEGSATFTDGTIVNSRRFGVMMHSGVGGGTLTIDKGSVFNSRSTAIQVKGRGTTITVDNAQLHAGNGILVQAMPNDDPFMRRMGAGGPGGPGTPPAPTPTAGGSGPGSAATVGTVGAAAKVFSPDVVARLANVSLTGDLINARPAQGDMIVSLDKASLTGAITTAVAVPSTGQEPTEATRHLIGDVKNIFGPSTDPKNGAQVSVGAGSTWSVAATSYLTRLTIADGGAVKAPAGKRVSLLVNGATRPLHAGNYAGKIVLKVSDGPR
jgi:hypothetical protein